MYIKYSLLGTVLACSTVGIVAQDKKITSAATIPTKTAPVITKKSDIVSSGKGLIGIDSSDLLIGVCDLYNAMASAEDGKEQQQAMEALQKELTNNLEQQRLTSAKKLEAFNAKKETLSKEAREKEEQELIALSRDLQNEVQKAQERIRQELNKATEELSRAAEQAAIEIAKADKLDLLIEKNTGRIIYSKEDYDVTARIEVKMNEQRKVRLAQNKKSSANTVIASASQNTTSKNTGASSDAKKAETGTAKA